MPRGRKPWKKSNGPGKDQAPKNESGFKWYIMATPKNKVWAPRKFETGEDLMNAFIEYCEFQVKNKRPITKTSFRAHVVLWHSYFIELDKVEFSDTLRTIDLICKAYAEEELFVGKNVAWVIFNLCNNYSSDYKNSRYNEHVGKEGKPLFEKISVEVIDAGKTPIN